LVWAKCLIVACGALLLFFSSEHKPGSWQRPLSDSLLLALFAARPLLLLRPVIVSLFFLALFRPSSSGFRRDGRIRHLLVLPLAKYSGQFSSLSALGPAMVGAHAASAGLALAFGGKRAWFFALNQRGRAGVTSARKRSRSAPAARRSCSRRSGFWGSRFGHSCWGVCFLAPTTSTLRTSPRNVPPFLLERFSTASSGTSSGSSVLWRSPSPVAAAACA